MNSDHRRITIRGSAVRELLLERIRRLEEEVAISDKLLAEQHRLMDEIPACPAHGNRCIPHAIEWVREMRILAADHSKE